ncbi:MAG: amino acid permease-associated region [Bacteroidota bacterium]|nr:amino acid permease-associated region [Bacteroidota bacterium]
MSKKYSLNTATAVVIANMIGTGVFGSLGFQLLDLHDYASIIILWVLGGTIALCGAFAYSELGAALPRSGGEYNFLTEIFHPSVGFLSGWVSAIIGFSAPIALAASLLGGYFGNVIAGYDARWIGAAVIVGITIIQSMDYRIGGGFQSFATMIKIVLILVFVVCGFMFAPHQAVSFVPSHGTVTTIFSGGFAAALVYVNFAYSGWNASSYIAGEIRMPWKNIPLSIISGTAIVTLLYVLLNFIFLYVAPGNEMAGVKEVAFIPAKYIFGESGGRVISLIISMLLISTISSMIIAGPRVLQRMGEDFSIFQVISHKNKHGIPAMAIWFQSIVALVILFTSSFNTILGYTTFVLTLFSTLTVIGVFVLRLKKPNLLRPYKTFGYPFTTIFFVAANLWFMYFWASRNLEPSLIGLGIVAVGLLVYFAADYLSKHKNKSNSVHQPKAFKE